MAQLRAGRLKHRVRIENPTEGIKAPNGEQLPAGWESLTTDPIPAGVETLSTRDYFAAQETHNETTLRVVMRKRPGVTSQSRIVWLTHGTERILEPTGPPLERNNGQNLEVLCRESV